MSDQSLDMVLHDGGQRLGCPSAARNPVRQLADPDKVVAADFLSLALSEVEDNVASREVENILFRFGVHELRTLEDI